MNTHNRLYNQIRQLRKKGMTYTEINNTLGENIPKSSLSYICKGISLTDEQLARIEGLARERMITNRVKAVQANRKIFNNKLESYRLNNKSMNGFMQSRQAKLVALTMLYLGEGAKWKSRRGLMLGSSDPEIIKLYIKLIEDCYGITRSSMRARVQHRADQSSEELKAFWSQELDIPLNHFYPTYIDKRTIGKITKKIDYKGVCAISCAGTHVQLELQEIAVIINKALGC